jgi:hypothetical protein
MTDSIDQIILILQSALPTYAVDIEGEHLAPALTVLIDGADNSSALSKDHIYRIIIRATSLAKLESAINTLLKLDSTNEEGYVTSTVPILTDTVPNVYLSYNAGSYSTSDFDTYTRYTPLTIFKMNYATIPSYIVFFITPVTAGITTMKLMFTPKATKTVLMLIFSTILDDLSEASFQAQLNTSETLFQDAVQMVADTPMTIDLPIPTLDGWNGLYITASGMDAADVEIDASDSALVLLTYTQGTPTDFPIHIEMKYTTPPAITENDFEAEVNMRTRWPI